MRGGLRYLNISKTFSCHAFAIHAVAESNKSKKVQAVSSGALPDLFCKAT